MTEIPNAFGGFAPFPNTIMIPTMGLQSDVIGFRFGFGYEKGKRTLRALSNDEFNAMDEVEEQAIYKRHETTAINFFKLEIQTWTNLQKIIIEKSVEIEVMKANRTPSAFREMFEGFTSGFGSQQVEDAKNFFGGINDALLNMMAWFSGFRPTVNKQPVQPEPKRPTKFKPKPVSQPFVQPLKQPVIPTIPKVKKIAGLWQIATRKQLIREIASAGQLYKLAKTASEKKKYADAILIFQQRLVNLLAMYRF